MSPILNSFSIRNYPETEAFPFNLPLIKNFESLAFSSNVTFFVGENGAGKSTILEALAANLNLPTAGSSSVEIDPLLAPARHLASYLRLRMAYKTTQGFFSRAEDFIGFVKGLQRQIAELNAEIEEIENTWQGGDITLALGPLKGERDALISRYGEDLDAMSHGEGFLKFFLSRITGKGLYLIDEPEAALSPQRQLSLISLIMQKVKENGSQFIIATHSPIIMSIPEAEILEFKEGKISPIAYQDTEHYQITKMFLDRPGAFLRGL
ncbi:AAA family ATPase [Marinilongibacter aquaticus]|uniref:AAA family ATPase n=1 Tax=Marinilongibacter aquaticus TaxID=2975157 RepID=UPI0021BDC4EE|nr:AAA family ATPase [Marinilongibacter aquaticus]UBM57461.1 AAA family ATPase [Marinilongibacter aquaticus]